MARPKAKRRAKAAPKAKRNAARAPRAPETQRGAIPGPQESPREQAELESIEDPLEDWPEEGDSDEDRWLIERRGDDLENPGD